MHLTGSAQRGVLRLLVAAGLGLALIAQTSAPAQAAASVKRIRIYMDVNAQYSGSGNPLNGVSGKLKVHSNWNSSITGQYSHIEMNDGASYVQFGVFQGRNDLVRDYGQTNQCAVARQTFSAPQLMLILKAPNYCTGLPEIAYPLGAFGSTGNFRQFGLRRNSNGTYYATLDGVTKYTTLAALPAAMTPNVGMDGNDTCASMTHNALDSANNDGATLALHDNVQGWRYWSSGVYYLEPSPPTGYSYGRYSTAYYTHFAGGPSAC